MDQESYSEGDVDFKTQLTSILGKNPEVVFCPNYYQEVGQILAQAESVGLTGFLLLRLLRQGLQRRI